jgi:DNA-directed RNA polymerase specialized sigma24 family protein
MTEPMGQAVPDGAPGFDALLKPPEYWRLRDRLIRIFARRGCEVPEDLADETISRVLGRLPDIAESYEGDPVLFVLAVARNVHREYLRRPRTVPWLELDKVTGITQEESSARERASDCLDACLSRLSPTDGRLIREYYRDDEARKIDRRKALAMEQGMEMNTLRVKAFRIRARLARCVFDCSKKRDEG